MVAIIALVIAIGVATVVAYRTGRRDAVKESGSGKAFLDRIETSVGVVEAGMVERMLASVIYDERKIAEAATYKNCSKYGVLLEGMVHCCVDALASGEGYVYRGVLDFTGNAMLKCSKFAWRELVKEGRITEEIAREELAHLMDVIRTNG